MALQEVLGEGGQVMTKSEMCTEAMESLMKWGIPGPYIFDDDGFSNPHVGTLLTFAESLAEKRWPGLRFWINLSFVSIKPNVGYAASSGVYGETTIKYPTIYGRHHKDPWRAVFNLIEKMKEG
jgi:hypothetical protein